MSLDLQRIVDSVRAKYLAWSDNIPFAEVVFDGATVYEPIPYNFQLPSMVIRPDAITIDNLDEKIVRILLQREMWDFVQRLKNPSSDHQFETKLSQLTTTVSEAYEKMFVDIANPNFIFFPRKLRGEYLKQVKLSGRKTADVDVPSEILNTNSNEIFMIVQSGFKKIYPSNNRIVINIDSTHGVNIKFEISIHHRVEITNNDSFARITVSNN